jgi:hypothetical protein
VLILQATGNPPRDQKELTQGHSIFQRRLRFFHEIAEDLLVYLSPGIVEKTFDFPDKKIDIFQKLPAGESLSRKAVEKSMINKKSTSKDTLFVVDPSLYVYATHLQIPNNRSRSDLV